MDVLDERKTSIYCLNDPRDGRLRYVGKADDPYRRWKGHISTAPRSINPCGAWIRELLTVGPMPELEILEEIPMAGWQEIEKEYIRVFRMSMPALLNKQGGGQGICQGHKVTEATRAKMGVSRKGKPLTLEHRAKLCKAQKNRLPPTPETCAKFSAANRKRKQSHPDNYFSKTGLENMRQANRGNKYCVGRVLSGETRVKIRDSVRAFYAKRRAQEISQDI